jgi:ribosomal protein S30
MTYNLNQYETLASPFGKTLDLGRFVLTGRIPVSALICTYVIMAWAMWFLPVQDEYRPGSKPVPVVQNSGSQGSVVDAGDVGKPKPVLAKKPKKAAVPRHEEYVTWYIARGYRLNKDFAKDVVSNAVKVGKELDVDPLLILSVIAIESSFNPKAQSSVGAQGLMQVHTRVHKEKFSEQGSRQEQFSIYENLRVGTRILKGYISRSGSVAGGLKRYVGAANLPSDGGYGQRVMREYSRLSYAARGYVSRSVNLLWKGLDGPEVPANLSSNTGSYRPYELFFMPGTDLVARKILATSAS